MFRILLLLTLLLSWISGASAETISLPLQRFTSAAAMEMRCISGGQNLSFPIPDRWKVLKASVTLHYTSSNNLVGDISQMVVKLNGEPITQVKLNPIAPTAAVEIPLPLGILENGYNDLSFQVAQHYQRNACEQPCAPDLWTAISLSQSTLHIEYETKPLPMALGAAIGQIFDPKQFSNVNVNVVADAESAETMTMAGIVASGIARHFDYRKVSFTHSRDIQPGMDNVLLGDGKFVDSVLERYQLKLPGGDGGLIKLLPLPQANGGADKMHALVSISGDSAQALKIAAQTFANMSFPYPGTDELRAYAFSIPDISMYGGRQVLTADKVYPFSDLGMSSYMFQGQTGKPSKRGFTGSPSELVFRLPADFMIKQNQHVKLKLNFAYGAGLRNDSTVTVTVNGAQVRDIHLDQVGGSFIEGYKLDLPTYLFKPGTNVITFRPFLNTPRQVCDVAITDGLFVSIFENSTLWFPPMPHFVEMPRLDLFALNGFPFTKWPDGYQTLVYLPKPDGASIDTALNLIGMISQRNGFPLFGTQISYTEPTQWEGETLVVGLTSSIPKGLLEHAPLQTDTLGNVPYPVNRSWDSETSIAQSRQLSGLGPGSGLLMQFESARTRGRSVILVTAQNEKDLSTMGDAMLQSGILSRISGDLSLIKLNVPDYDVVSLTAGKKYATSDSDKVSIIDSIMFTSPYVLYALMALALVVLGLLGYLALRRYRRSRLSGG